MSIVGSKETEKVVEQHECEHVLQGGPRYGRKCCRPATKQVPMGYGVEFVSDELGQTSSFTWDGNGRIVKGSYVVKARPIGWTCRDHAYRSSVSKHDADIHARQLNENHQKQFEQYRLRQKRLEIDAEMSRAFANVTGVRKEDVHVESNTYYGGQKTEFVWVRVPLASLLDLMRCSGTTALELDESIKRVLEQYKPATTQSSKVDAAVHVVHDDQQNELDDLEDSEVDVDTEVDDEGAF